MLAFGCCSKGKRVRKEGVSDIVVRTCRSNRSFRFRTLTEDTTARDGDATQELVQLLVVLDGEGDVPGYDTALLVVTGGVPGEFQDLGAQVLEHGSQVDGGAGTHTGGVLALAKVTADTTDGELFRVIDRL